MMMTAKIHENICTRIIIMKQSSSISPSTSSSSSSASSLSSTSTSTSTLTTWKTMMIIGIGLFLVQMLQPHQQVHGAYHLMKYGRRFPLSMSMSMANERRSSTLFNRTARLSNVFDRFQPDDKLSLLVPLNQTTKLTSIDASNNRGTVFGQAKVENSFGKVLERKPPAVPNVATTSKSSKSKPRKVIAATITTQSTLMKHTPSASSTSLSPSIQIITANEHLDPNLIANRGAFGFRKPRTSLNKT